MDNKEMVIEILKTTGCLTAREIANFVYRRFGEHISTQSAVSALRPLFNENKAGVSTNEKGQKVYWLVK